MTIPRDSQPSRAHLSKLEKTLADALKTGPLAQASLDRIRAVVGAEWHAATAASRSRWVRPRLVRRVIYGMAASVLVVLFAYWFATPPIPGARFASIVRLSAVGLEVRSGYFRHRAVRVGDSLRVGDRFTAPGPILINLDRGGSLRVAAGSRLSIDTEKQLSVERGLIYVDFPASITNPMRVSTTAGDVEHIGTGFEVLSDGQGVRIRVREGRIRFTGKSATLTADQGVELVAMPGSEITRHPVDTYGRDWLWLADLAPDYEIEGTRLIDFLQWVSRELGRPLDFADARSRQLAEQTILHGSVRGQLPIEALSHVLTTTTLAYKIHDEAILVRFGP